MTVAAIGGGPERHARKRGETSEPRVVVECGDLRRAAARVGDAAEDVAPIAVARPPRAAVAWTGGGLESIGDRGERPDLARGEDVLHEREAGPLEEGAERGVVERERTIQRCGER